MNLSDYEAVWKRQELPRGAEADLTELKRTFAAQHRKMERTILLRNLIEGGGGLLASLGFGLLTWRMGITGWSIILGLALIAGVSGVFLHDGWRFRRVRPGPETPLLARLESGIAELRHQRGLITHIGKWYLTTYLAAMLLIGHGLLQHTARTAPPGMWKSVLTTPSTLAWVVVLLGTMAGAIVWWWLDVQKSIRLRIDPRLAELEKLRRDLVRAGD